MTYDDVAGLIDLMGGKDKALARLDTFFHVGSTLTVSGGGEGRFDASNEPDIQTPWLYDYMGAPSKTQETVRAVVNQLWTNTPSGITGNDDLGTMSAWNVWASLGMYPQVPSRADLVLASPLFPHIVIHRGNGKTITIDAPGANADTKYVKSLTVNGRSSDKPWLSSSLVSHGGRLRYGLQTTPSSWGSDAADAPPSLSNPPTIDVTHAGDAVKVRAGDTMSGLDGAPSCTVDGQSLRLRPAGEDTWTAVVRSRGSHTVRCTTTNVFGTSASASDVVEGRARS